jgi:uncharacterized protein YbaP (TraB family)
MICMPLRRMRLTAALLAVLACVPSAAARAQSLAGVARPPAAQTQGTSRGLIWKVERDGRQAWLVGSMHLLTPDFYPLPASMEQAFAKSTVLMEEIDMNEASNPQLAASILAKAMNPPGTTLSGQLSKETIAVVSTWLAKMGLTLESLQPLKPWMVSITVQTLALQRIGFDPALGIDKHFQDAAARAGKRLQPLETALEQISFLDGLSPKTQDLMLRESVESAESEQSQIKSIAAAWRSGDVPAMERLALADMKDAPEVYDMMLVSRNRRWVPKVEACMQTSQCFVVVGAAHLIGPDGLVTLLQQRGYTVTQQ